MRRWCWTDVRARRHLALRTGHPSGPAGDVRRRSCTRPGLRKTRHCRKSTMLQGRALTMLRCSTIVGAVFAKPQPFCMTPLRTTQCVRLCAVGTPAAHRICQTAADS